MKVFSEPRRRQLDHANGGVATCSYFEEHDILPEFETTIVMQVRIANNVMFWVPTHTTISFAVLKERITSTIFSTGASSLRA